MMFDVTSYVKFINAKCESYMAEILKELTVNNPKWIQSMLNDKEFFNEDGSPVTDMSKERMDEKILSVVNDADFKGYKANLDTINKLFVVTQEDLKAFIIDENGHKDKGDS